MALDDVIMKINGSNHVRYGDAIVNGGTRGVSGISPLTGCTKIYGVTRDSIDQTWWNRLHNRYDDFDYYTA